MIIPKRIKLCFFLTLAAVLFLCGVVPVFAAVQKTSTVGKQPGKPLVLTEDIGFHGQHFDAKFDEFIDN